MAPRTLKNTRARNRSAMDPSVPAKLTPAIISSFAIQAPGTVQVTFETRIMVRGLPAFRAGATGDETVQSVNMVSDTVVDLVFTGAVATTTMIVPEGDPAIRTPTGGFVPAGNYDLPGIVP